MGNSFKTAFLLTILTILVIFCGYALGGMRGMMAAFTFACLMNLGSYWFSDRIVLTMHRAQPLTEDEAPEVLRS